MSKNNVSSQTTPEEILNILKEVSKSQKELTESQEETDRQMKETDRKIKELTESQKETDKHLKKVENIFNGQWGKLVESLVEGDIVKLLNQRNIKVESLSNIRSSSSKEGKHYEFDIIAINGEEVVVTEVKTTLKVRDVDHFIDKLKDFKKVYKDHKNRKIYGAVAYLKADDSSNIYSEKQGLFVIRATGSSASIINEENFKPTEF